jgi:hypothetical protein
MTRYGSAAAERETEQPSTAQQRLDQQNAAQWATWANDVNEKLAEIDTLRTALMGGSDKDKDPGLLLDLTRQTYEDTRAETAETVKSVSDALSARIEAEVAVLRDEFIERLDALLLQHSPKKLRTMETGLRKDMNDRTNDLDERIEKLVASVDAVDKRRRYDRNTSRTERDELAVNLASLAETRAAGLEKKIAELAKALDDLERRTGEAFEAGP